MSIGYSFKSIHQEIAGDCFVSLSLFCQNNLLDNATVSSLLKVEPL